MTNQTKNSMLLMLCALIWGTAFVAQSAGSGMGAFSFLAGRSWMAVLVLLPTVKAFDALHHRQGRPDGKPKTAAERKLLLKAGLMCGTLLFLASAAQQLGITLDPSTAKAGFLTAMYVVLVPVFGLFLGRKGSAQLWVSMAIAVVGLYLLCMKDGFGSIQSSDWLLLLCAVLFSFQIMAVDHFSPQMDGVRLSLVEFFVVSVESTVAAFFVRAACHGRVCHLRRAYPVLRHHVQRRGLHPADSGSAGPEPRRCQPDHVSGKRIQRLGRLAAAAPEPFLPGIYRLRAAVCRRGAGTAAPWPPDAEQGLRWRQSRAPSCAAWRASSTSWCAKR